MKSAYRKESNTDNKEGAKCACNDEERREKQLVRLVSKGFLKGDCWLFVGIHEEDVRRIGQEVLRAEDLF
jgi:hypothetical protein